MPKIYVVIWFSGEYDDYMESIDKAFYSKKEAQDYIDREKRKHPSSELDYRIDEVELKDKK